jgi:hypothetical protein
LLPDTTQMGTVNQLCTQFKRWEAGWSRSHKGRETGTAAHVLEFLEHDYAASNLFVAGHSA